MVLFFYTLSQWEKYIQTLAVDAYKFNTKAYQWINYNQIDESRQK